MWHSFVLAFLSHCFCYFIHMYSMCQIYGRRMFSLMIGNGNGKEKGKEKEEDNYMSFSIVKNNSISDIFYSLHDLQQYQQPFDFIQCTLCNNGYKLILFITSIPISEISFAKTKFMWISFQIIPSSSSSLAIPLSFRMTTNDYSYYVEGTIFNEKVICYLLQKHNNNIVIHNHHLPLQLCIMDKKMKTTNISLNEKTFIILQQNDFITIHE